jgi:hypothetical protein
MWRFRAASILIVRPQGMDLKDLENIDDFVGGVASSLHSHTSPSRPIRTPSNLAKANGSYALC